MKILCSLVQNKQISLLYCGKYAVSNCEWLMLGYISCSRNNFEFKLTILCLDSFFYQLYIV